MDTSVSSQPTKISTSMCGYMIDIPIIEGIDCVLDLNKYLCPCAQSDRYYTVKDDVAIRVYKRTKRFQLTGDYIITELLLMPDTYVHVGSNWWKEPYHMTKNAHIIKSDFHPFKCRANIVFVANSIDMKTQRKISFAYSIYDSNIEYVNNRETMPSAFLCAYSVDTDTTCGSGIHFFFIKEQAESYDFS